MKILQSTKSNDGHGLGDAGAERAALTRLRIASNLSGGTPVREFDTGSRTGAAGWWFMLQLGTWRTKVADAVLSIRESSGGTIGAIEQLMQQANVDVARVSIVRSATEPGNIAEEAESRRRLWFFQAHREHRDLLPLGDGVEGLLKRLGAHTRRNIRRTERIAQETGLRFHFHERTSAIAIDEQVKALAAQNSPVPIATGSITVFEQMLSHRPNTFDARIIDAGGRLLSLCRGFISGRTAFLVYQVNNPAVPRINLGLFHTYKVIEELSARGACEAIFVTEGRGLLKAACRVSSKEELITIRRSLRGLAMAAGLAVALKGTRFGEAMRYVVKSIFRHWMRLPKLSYDHAVASVAPPGPHWARAIGAAVGLTVSLSAVGAGIMVRSGVEYVPYITAYPAIILTTYLAGAWTGLMAVAIGGLGILYYVIPPYDSFALDTDLDIISTGLYVLSAFPLWRWFVRYVNSLNTA
jgi:hypothetical protein